MKACPKTEPSPAKRKTRRCPCCGRFLGLDAVKCGHCGKVLCIPDMSEMLAREFKPKTGLE